MNKRKTGRTTRMLKHAQELSDQGRAIYIIADNYQRVRMIKRKIGLDYGIKVETVESAGNFDWQTLSLRGVNPNVVVLIDHRTIERRFARIIESLTRYDSADDKDHKPLKHSELIEQHE